MKVVDKQKALSGGVLEAKDDPMTHQLAVEERDCCLFQGTIDAIAMLPDLQCSACDSFRLWDVKIAPGPVSWCPPRLPAETDYGGREAGSG